MTNGTLLFVLSACGGVLFFCGCGSDAPKGDEMPLLLGRDAGARDTAWQSDPPPVPTYPCDPWQEDPESPTDASAPDGVGNSDDSGQSGDTCAPSGTPCTGDTASSCCSKICLVNIRTQLGACQ